MITKHIKGFYMIMIMLLCVISCSINKRTSELGKHPLYRIQVGNKYGYIDERGKIVIEPQYDWGADIFSEDVCFARIGDRKVFIDRIGNTILELDDSIKRVDSFQSGFSRAYSSYLREGIINKKGELVIPAINAHVDIDNDGESVYFLIHKEDAPGGWYITDPRGNSIGEPYDSIYGFSNGLCGVKLGEKWGYINPHGQVVIDAVFDKIRSFSKDGVAFVVKGGKVSIIDKSGKSVAIVDRGLTNFRCNRAFVTINGEKCLIDKTGRKVCNIDAETVSHYSEEEGVATVLKNGVATIIDTMGGVVISTSYGQIGPFIGGIAPARKDERLGFIDRTGRELIKVDESNVSYEYHDKNYYLRKIWNRSYRTHVFYNQQGNMVWKDQTGRDSFISPYPDREFMINFFDRNLAYLDPIEGIYYVTEKDYYQDRDNTSLIGLNDSESHYYAIAYDKEIDGFRSHLIDGSGLSWINKIVRIGETNNYAVLPIKNDNKYSSEGRFSLNDLTGFEIRLEMGHNDGYNFFETREFIRDYPSISDIEKIQKAEWTGTGFAISDGFVATNYHVTSGAKSIRVRGVNGNMNKSYSGVVVASDKEHDISIIRIVDKSFESLGSIPYKIGNASVEVGDDIFVLGYPMTSSMGEEIKVTNGIISSSSGFKGDVSQYQISAAAQPGNSGGPVFNSEGTVIAIVCAKHTDAENATYAVKVSFLYSLISSSNLGIDIHRSDKTGGKKLSGKVKRIKDFIYLVECRR